MKKHQQTRRNHLNHVLIENVSFKNWTDNWEKKFSAPTKVGVSIICFKISKSTDEQTATVQRCFFNFAGTFFSISQFLVPWKVLQKVNTEGTVLCSLH